MFVREKPLASGIMKSQFPLFPLSRSRHILRKNHTVFPFSFQACFSLAFFPLHTLPTWGVHKVGFLMCTQTLFKSPRALTELKASFSVPVCILSSFGSCDEEFSIRTTGFYMCLCSLCFIFIIFGMLNDKPGHSNFNRLLFSLWQESAELNLLSNFTFL